MMFDNRVLRKIFGPKRIEVTGEYRKLHNIGLYNLYSLLNHSGDRIKKHEMGGAYSMHGGEGWCVQVLVEKLEGNNHFKNLYIDGRIILILIFKELNLQEVEWKVMDWIELTLDWDRWGTHVNVIISCWENAGYFLTI
jgi:hypothetical protein